MASTERGGTARPVPAGSLLLRHIRKLATFTEQGEIDDAAIFIESNVVVWVGLDADLPGEHAAADLVLDMSLHVVIPGGLHYTLPPSAAPNLTLFFPRILVPYGPEIFPGSLVAFQPFPLRLVYMVPWMAKGAARPPYFTAGHSLISLWCYAGLINTHHHMFQVRVHPLSPWHSSGAQ